MIILSRWLPKVSSQNILFQNITFCDQYWEENILNLIVLYIWRNDSHNWPHNPLEFSVSVAGDAMSTVPCSNHQRSHHILLWEDLSSK